MKTSIDWETLRRFGWQGAEDVHEGLNEGHTALGTAVHYVPEQVSALLEHGAYVDGCAPGEKIKHFSAPLMIASLYRPEIVPLLLESGAQLEARNEGGQTALMVSVGNPEGLKVLLKAGADMEAKDDRGRTALMEATAYDNESFEILLKAGAQVNHVDVDNNDAATLLFIYSKTTKTTTSKKSSNRLILLWEQGICLQRVQSIIQKIPNLLTQCNQDLKSQWEAIRNQTSLEQMTMNVKTSKTSKTRL